MGAHMCAYCNCDPCKCRKGEGRHKVKNVPSPIAECAWCNCDPCKCKPGEGRHNTVKMENCRDPGPSIIERIKQAEASDPFPRTPCGSCGLLKCDCVYKEGWFGYLKDGDMDKATLAAQMEDLGNSYRRMAKCVVICDAADIDLPKWCKEDLLKWARKEVGDNERYMAST